MISKKVFLGCAIILDMARPDFITLGDNVSLAGGVYILTHSNPTTPRIFRSLFIDLVSRG